MIPNTSGQVKMGVFQDFGGTASDDKRLAEVRQHKRLTGQQFVLIGATTQRLYPVAFLQLGESALIVRGCHKKLGPTSKGMPPARVHIALLRTHVFSYNCKARFAFHGAFKPVLAKHTKSST